MQPQASFNLRCGSVTALVAALLAASPRARADYPIVSHRYLADPGSLVHDGRIYLYNSNDDDNAVEGGYTMHSIVCVSTSDLKNWTDHGIVFTVPADASWASNSWAPQPIERDGTIFLYFGNSGSGIGVGSSKDPTGHFKDAKGGYLINSSTPGASGAGWLFDPGALIDDDGQAYLAFGGNGETNARIIKLGADLASVSGTAAGLSPKGFFEASFLFKRGNTYYFSYSTNSANGMRIDYLTSSSPMSGYSYGGVVAGQPPENGNNNHASQFLFKGQWYHAFHNRVVAKKAGTPDTYKRNLGIEVLDFNADGSIKQVTYTTDGVPQLGSLNPYVRVEAETTNAQSGIETEACKEGGMDVTSIDNGDWIRVRGVDFGSAGAESFTARVASSSNGGAIELHLGSATGTLIGTCAVPSTGGAQIWDNATCDVTGATGVKDLYLKFTGGNFNVNHWQFTPVGGVLVGAGGSSGTGGTKASGGTSSAGSNSNTSSALSTGGRGTNASGATSKAGGTKATGGASSGKGGAVTSNAGGASSNAGGGTATDVSTTSANASGVTTNVGTSGVSSTKANASGPAPSGGTSAVSTTRPNAGGNETIAGASTTNTSTDTDGCGCHMAERDVSSRSLLGIGLLGVVLAAQRRRRTRGAA
ncbi:MAG TPA: glycoside hydrolase family 43 protein [Polyangiaceae bacterium]|nr:glycoside hydrolase family 43 protein [Polyangiaceae bacterium]